MRGLKSEKTARGVKLTGIEQANISCRKVTERKPKHQTGNHKDNNMTCEGNVIVEITKVRDVSKQPKGSDKKKQ